MQSMVEGWFRQPLMFAFHSTHPSVRPAACHLPVPGRNIRVQSSPASGQKEGRATFPRSIPTVPSGPVRDRQRSWF